MAGRVVDGSQGEGGGQILRTALALAALLGEPLEIVNIRANRAKPGLRPQHLAAVRALAEISSGRLTGADKGSTRLCYTPGTLRGGTYRFAIGTAGSITLLLATILPPLLFADRPSTVVIDGGTHVPFAPPFPYLAEVFLPALARLGARVSVSLRRWGFYPEGGGRIECRVEPVDRLTAAGWPQRGPLAELRLEIVLARLAEHIAEREEHRVRKTLAGHSAALTVTHHRPPAAGSGNALFLLARYGRTAAGFSSLGQRGRPAEKVADALCREFEAFAASPGTVDRHLADQLVLYLALAQGRSELQCETVTSHLRTNIGLAEALLPVRFSLDQADGRLAVAGLGFSR